MILRLWFQFRKVQPFYEIKFQPFRDKIKIFLLKAQFLEGGWIEDANDRGKIVLCGLTIYESENKEKAKHE